VTVRALRSVRTVLSLLTLVCSASLAAQSASTPALDSAIARARRLVNEGAGAVGRSVVDSVLARVTPGSPDEATILYWRATLAESWEMAQQDYLRLMLEFDGSALAGEAMLRLAQGELARGDRAAAEQYLERLARETPDVPARAEAALWHGRLLLERGEAATACPMLRDGRARLGRAARDSRAPREATGTDRRTCTNRRTDDHRRTGTSVTAGRDARRGIASIPPLAPSRGCRRFGMDRSTRRLRHT